MAPRLLANKWRTQVGRYFINSIQPKWSNSAVYAFAGKHVPEANGGVVDANDTPNQVVRTYRDMIFAKRVQPNDAVLMIQRIPYTSNTLYAMYDDQDVNLLTENYYAIVNAGSFSHVWKCLDNNLGNNSTVTPDFSVVNGTTDTFRFGDGYVWKYMYSTDDSTVSRFGTSQLFPVTPNNSVASIAVDGSVDVVHVDSPGQGYGNYLTGTFSAGDIRVNGNALLYAVSSNVTASSTNGYYTGCYMYLATGTGAGQFQKVTNYITNANGKFAVIASPFPITPLNGTTFQLNPGVTITGDGTQTQNAIAMGLVNAVGNSIYRVQMLQNGAAYKFLTANVIANAVVGVTANAIVRPIYSPMGGHGSDAASELGANVVCVSVKFQNTESNTIPATNQYQQVGLVFDPLFSNSVLTINANHGIFQMNEKVFVVQPIPLTTNVCVVNTSSAMVSNGINFDRDLTQGQAVYLSTNDTTSHQLGFVNSVVNSSAFLLTVNGFFVSNVTGVYLANTPAFGLAVNMPTVNSVAVANLSGAVASNDLVVGLLTGAMGTVASVSRSGVTKGYGTLIGTTQLLVNTIVGTFTQNEQIFVGASLATSTSNGAFHSNTAVVGANATIYVSNAAGSWLSGTITGANSGATAVVLAYYPPEIAFRSGKLDFIQNIAPIPRSGANTEQIQFILTF